MLPKTPIEIDGTTYNLCFDFRALREAENAYKAEGHHSNLLVTFRNFDFESVSLVFPCAVRRFHPELSWEQAQAMVHLGSVFDIGNAIAAAWLEAQPKKPAPVKGDPAPEEEGAPLGNPQEG